MYGSIPSIVKNAIDEAESHRLIKNKQRELMKSTLSPEDFKEWQKYELEERRHQETCQAIRASRPSTIKSDDTASLGFAILAGGLIGSMGD